MGMPAYKDLTDEDLTALMHFIRKKAHESEGVLIDKSKDGR